MIICALFLSKFDDLAYKALGFSSFIEAFNVLGFSLQGKPICVEVKELSENKEQFLLTQKEYEMADRFKENYCLFVVRNLKENPRESLFFNPLNHFKLKEQKITQKAIKEFFNVWCDFKIYGQK